MISRSVPADEPLLRHSSDASVSSVSSVSSNASIEDEPIDDIVRAIARAPAYEPSPGPRSGTRWGDRGRYIIERRLGRGGMGVVYLARDTLLARQVAVKVLDPGESPEDDIHRVRLLREARFAAAFEHERIARVYDVGEHDGFTFVAMEYVRGVTLRAWMGQPRLPSEVIDVVCQIAEGLGVLHGHGVIHRDLKPENVMLLASGGVKLLDFGLAGHVKRLLAPTAIVDDVERGSATTSSTFGGTPAYMASEQHAGDRGDARADVFALGVVVYEIVTGARPSPQGAGPAAAESSRNVARETQGQAVQGGALRGPTWAAFPSGLPELVTRMLARDREARPADGTVVLSALRAACGVRGEAPASVGPPRLGRWVGAGAAGLILTTLAFIEPRLMREARARQQLKLPPPPGMALVNVGTVDIGRTREEVASQCAELGPRCDRERLDSQVPARKVEVPAFYIDRHEVTNQEFVSVLNRIRATLFVARDDDDHSLRFVRYNSGLGHDGELLLDLFPEDSGVDYSPDSPYPGDTYRARPGREMWPVTQVSWYGADFYCREVGKRLPTNVEWEAAARGKENRAYPWGSKLLSCGEAAVPDDGLVPFAKPCAAPRASAQDVGSARGDVTPEGVQDLGGNVTEWVDFDAVASGSSDPATGQDRLHIVRGGSYFRSLMARTSARMLQSPNNVAPNGGFRCASNLVSTNQPGG